MPCVPKLQKVGPRREGVERLHVQDSAGLSGPITGSVGKAVKKYYLARLQELIGRASRSILSLNEHNGKRPEFKIASYIIRTPTT